MSTYDVKAVAQGESVNEVASKIMAAAYVMDFELDELEVSIRQDSEKVLFWEDAVGSFVEGNPVDNNFVQTFQFPHTRNLVEDLKKRPKNGN